MLGEHLGLEALVVEREAQVGAECSFELGQVSCVADHGDWLRRCERRPSTVVLVFGAGSGTGRPWASA